MKSKNCVVALYKAHFDAETAVKLLQKSGINMKQCSIVGQGYHTEEEVVGYYNAGDRMMFWGKQGAFWGGIWGLVFGSGIFWIPGIGPIMAGGAIVSSIVGGLEGAAVVGGLNALGAGLYSIGIPENSILQYETAIKANKFVVVFHETAEEIEKAREILDLTPKETLEVAVKENVAANK
ncbi:MAG: permease [Candidatus Ozemobacteraceae bacterium]